MGLTKTFNAVVIYKLHSNPPWLGLYSEELGYSQVYLGDLKLTDKEIDALCNAETVSGTYEKRGTPEELFVTTPESIKDPRKGLKLSTWRVTSVKPS